jgi:hypothetical protein
MGIRETHQTSEVDILPEELRRMDRILLVGLQI